MLWIECSVDLHSKHSANYFFFACSDPFEIFQSIWNTAPCSYCSISTARTSELSRSSDLLLCLPGEMTGGPQLDQAKRSS
jgi:hypothetical protein